MYISAGKESQPMILPAQQAFAADLVSAMAAAADVALPFVDVLYDFSFSLSLCSDSQGWEHKQDSTSRHQEPPLGLGRHSMYDSPDCSLQQNLGSCA